MDGAPERLLWNGNTKAGPPADGGRMTTVCGFSWYAEDGIQKYRGLSTRRYRGFGRDDVG